MKKCVTALDQTWHPDHFFCTQCGCQFGEDGFQEKDGKPYCKEDYLAMFALKCKGCTMAITEGYISALSGQWHPQCFVCRVGLYYSASFALFHDGRCFSVLSIFLLFTFVFSNDGFIRFVSLSSFSLSSKTKQNETNTNARAQMRELETNTGLPLFSRRFVLHCRLEARLRQVHGRRLRRRRRRRQRVMETFTRSLCRFFFFFFFRQSSAWKQNKKKSSLHTLFFLMPRNQW